MILLRSSDLSDSSRIILPMWTKDRPEWVRSDRDLRMVGPTWSGGETKMFQKLWFQTLMSKKFRTANIKSTLRRFPNWAGSSIYNYLQRKRIGSFFTNKNWIDSLQRCWWRMLEVTLTLKKATFQECQITCGSNTVKMKCKKATGKWKPSYKRFDFTKC